MDMVNDTDLKTFMNDSLNMKTQTIKEMQSLISGGTIEMQ